MATTAEQLKADANELFLKGDYEGACLGYARALKVDPNNAVLYGNRAQANIALKKFLDAVADASKAVELDPSFCKGWARLAKAEHSLNRYGSSIASCKRALAALPEASAMTETERRLKAQCETGLKAVERDFESARWQERRGWEDGSRPVNFKPGGNLPWDRARSVLNQLQIDREKSAVSSAWVIATAFREFDQGTQGLKQMKRLKKGDEDGWQGITGVLRSFTEGILREPRVFHMDGPEWVERYNVQVRFECQQFDAWGSGGADVVQEQALARLHTKGWDNVRPAIRTTLWGWILSGFITGGAQRDPVFALDYYSRAMQILVWGRTVWKDVHRDDRGSVFEPTFFRGVRRLFFQSFIEAYMQAPGPDSEYNLDDLYEMARDYIQDAQSSIPSEANPPPYPLDPGTVLSYWMYPIAEGHSVLAFVHFRKAMETTDENEMNIQFEKAARMYVAAAEGFPVDDEKHAYFLAVAIDAFWHRGTPLEELLPLCKRIRDAIPEMKKIWEYSQMAHGRDAMLKQALDFEDEYRGKLDRGECKLQDIARPLVKLHRSTRLWRLLIRL
ncbi:hypothetical protein OF83DRAFT_1048116 [Amylostereum chailletii]|nr:hypothetical protein OF83DRAFT_1048116 [Amylostereum chailletii]